LQDAELGDEDELREMDAIASKLIELSERDGGQGLFDSSGEWQVDVLKQVQLTETFRRGEPVGPVRRILLSNPPQIGSWNDNTNRGLRALHFARTWVQYRGTREAPFD
jgi:hypothetical protein